MNTAIWRSLLWKEWREHRWKLLVLVLVAVGIHTWAVLVRDPGPDHYANPFWATLYLLLPIGSAFIAMGLAASERSQRTAAFIQSSPVNLRWLAAIKLAVGVATVVAAVAVSLVMTRGLISLADAYHWQPDAKSLQALESVHYLVEAGHWFLSTLIIAIAVSVSFILWFAAPAVNSKSEVRAGAIGLVVVALAWTLAIWFFSQFLIGRSADWVSRLVVGNIAAVLPGGIVVALGIMGDASSSSLFVIPSYLTAHALLAWWYVTRFGYTDDRERARLNDATPLVALTPVWLRPARHSPLTALLWKHTRECAPIVLAGAVGALGLAATTILVQYNSYATFDWLDITSESILVAFMTLGCCAGLVCGAGVLTSELEPRIYTFWRTRPISIDLWFAIAFLGGLVLLMVVFGIPIAVAYQFVVPEQVDDEPPLLVILAILVLSYVSGAFAASFVRNAVYASIIGLCVAGTAVAGVAYMLMREMEYGGIDIPGVWMGVAMLAVSALLGVAAWVCVRNDWSLRLS